MLRHACAQACRELGLEIVEMNASDNRNAEDVDRVLGGMAGNCAITSFFAPKSTPGGVAASGAKQRNKKLVLIMDEVDGMSSGDQGGIQVCALLVINRRC